MQVLVVCPDDYDRAMFAGVAGYEFHFLPPAPSHWHPDPDFDSLACLDRAIAYAREHRIDAVVSTHDLGDLIAALAARELDLPGPDPESVFLALHKFYGRSREGNRVRCQAIPLRGPVPEISYPAFCKAPWLKLGLLGHRLEGRADLEAALDNARREYPGWSRQYYPLFERAVDATQYPLATADIMLVEEFIEGRQATVEGWVHHGETGIWTVVDTNTMPGSQVIDNFSLPSRLPASVQDAMKKHAAQAIRSIGLDNSFFNIEMWHTSRGIVTTEINARAAVCFNEIYELSLQRSIFPAIAGLACGCKPCAPEPSKRVAAQCNITTFSEGRSAELFDYAAAADIPRLSILRPPDAYIRPISQFGVVLAQLEIAADSYEEISDRAEQVRRRLLRSTSSSKAARTDPRPPATPMAGVADLQQIAERAASRLSDGAWDAAALEEIANELQGLLVDATTLEQLRAVPSSDAWRELEIFDRPGVHASLFYLPAGAAIPLHDHPGMTVVSKVLEGRLRVRTLGWIDAHAGLARDAGEREMAVDDRAMVLHGSPGALHQITALAECVFLDLFAPYYGEDDGRDCSYYEMERGPRDTVKLCRRDHAGVPAL